MVFDLYWFVSVLVAIALTRSTGDALVGIAFYCAAIGTVVVRQWLSHLQRVEEDIAEAKRRAVFHLGQPSVGVFSGRRPGRG